MSLLWFHHCLREGLKKTSNSSILELFLQEPDMSEDDLFQEHAQAPDLFLPPWLCEKRLLQEELPYRTLLKDLLEEDIRGPLLGWINLLRYGPLRDYLRKCFRQVISHEPRKYYQDACKRLYLEESKYRIKRASPSDKEKLEKVIREIHTWYAVGIGTLWKNDHRWCDVLNLYLEEPLRKLSLPEPMELIQLNQRRKDEYISEYR